MKIVATNIIASQPPEWRPTPIFDKYPTFSIQNYNLNLQNTKKSILWGMMIAPLPLLKSVVNTSCHEGLTDCICQLLHCETNTTCRLQRITVLLVMEVPMKGR